MMMVASEKIDDAGFVREGNYASAGVYYEYGSYQSVKDGRTSAYVSVSDASNKHVIDTLVYDSGYDDRFVFLAEMEEGIIIVLSQTNYGDIFDLNRDYLVLRAHVYQDHALTLVWEASGAYDVFANHGCRLYIGNTHQGAWFDAAFSVVSEPYVSRVYDELFVYQYSGLARINGEEVEHIELTIPGHYDIEIRSPGYQHVFQTTIEAHPTGVEMWGEYDDPIEIHCAGDLVLNGQNYISGSPILSPGYHRFEVKGPGEYQKMWFFTIHPYLQGIEEGVDLAGIVEILSNAHMVTLDQKVYHGGYIVAAGSHEIVMYGVGGYEKHVSFRILPEVYGVIQDAIYQDIVEIWFNCVATLDGEMIEDHALIEQEGIHEIALYLDGDIYRTYRFEIIKNDTIINPEWLKYLPFGFILLVALGLVIALKKK
jgi:hypothetical protein